MFLIAMAAEFFGCEGQGREGFTRVTRRDWCWLCSWALGVQMFAAASLLHIFQEVWNPQVKHENMFLQ